MKRLFESWHGSVGRPVWLEWRRKCTITVICPNTDVLGQIAMFLKPADVYSLSLTCKHFKENGKLIMGTMMRAQLDCVMEDRTEEHKPSITSKHTWKHITWKHITWKHIFETYTCKFKRRTFISVVIVYIRLYETVLCQ